MAAATGCGSAPAPAASGTAAAEATYAAEMPRALVLPEQVVALAQTNVAAPTQHSAAFAPAGFEQPGSGTSGARIRALSATPAANSPDIIREPMPQAASSVAATAEAPQEDSRSPYLPLEMPAQPELAPHDVLPDLPPAPTFVDDSLRAPRTEQVGQEYFGQKNEGQENWVTREPAAPPPGPPHRAETAFMPQLQPQPEPRQLAPAAEPAVNRAAMEPVCQRALEISNHGYSLAQRGMLYASRAELIQSLQLVAQALDVQANTTAHATALSAGLTALKEAQDFAPPAGHLAAVLDVAEITRTHKTPVLKDAAEVSPVIAQQQYLGYAQSQLARAAGHEAVTSLTLYRLGKVQLAMAQQESDPQMLHGPQAMVFCQAAMAADERNFLAANELGVLMARYGQLQEARRLLIHSVSIQPKVEAWHNLSVVHKRLGEEELAKRAEHERELLAQRVPATTSVAGNIEWVDAKTFAARTPGEAPWAENVASQGNVRGHASVGISR
jgi:tetratricopeptide (TPR) repeat protein